MMLLTFDGQELMQYERLPSERTCGVSGLDAALAVRELEARSRGAVDGGREAEAARREERGRRRHHDLHGGPPFAVVLLPGPSLLLDPEVLSRALRCMSRCCCWRHQPQYRTAQAMCAKCSVERRMDSSLSCFAVQLRPGSLAL
jgi:hypothetical protein